MADPSNTLSDRNLEASTTLSLKREPACFAFLCSRAVSAPLPVDAINLDLASVDYFSGRASLWATLEVRSGATNEQPTAVLGFDETFLRPFTRALIEAAASRNPYRMTIMLEPGEAARQRVVEYVTGPGTALREVSLIRQDYPSHWGNNHCYRLLAAVSRAFLGWGQQWNISILWRISTLRKRLTSGILARLGAAGACRAPCSRSCWCGAASRRLPMRRTSRPPTAAASRCRPTAAASR